SAGYVQGQTTRLQFLKPISRQPTSHPAQTGMRWQTPAPGPRPLAPVPDNHGLHKVGQGCRNLRAHKHRALKSIALEDGFQIIERVAVRVGVLRVDAQLEDEAQSAPETARRFDQQHALAAWGTERKITLGQ